MTLTPASSAVPTTVAPAGVVACAHVDVVDEPLPRRVRPDVGEHRPGRGRRDGELLGAGAVEHGGGAYPASGRGLVPSLAA